MNYKISKNEYNEILESLVKITYNIAKRVVSQICTNSVTITNYYDYPYNVLETLSDKDGFLEIEAKSETVKNKFPLFSTHAYKEDYKYIIDKEVSSYYLKNNNIFNKLMELFQRNISIKDCFYRNETVLEYNLKMLITIIINRYLNTATVSEESINCDELIRLIELQLNRLFLKRLEIIVYVPIYALIFEENEINISDGIKIVKINDEIQKSRYHLCEFQSSKETEFVMCSKYMLEIKNYDVENVDSNTWYDASFSSNSYPNVLINDFFSSVRIVTGLRSGYGQLITSPLNWAADWYADLPSLYGSEVRGYNYLDVSKSYFEHNVSIINAKESQNIVYIYNQIIKIRKGELKGINQKIILALNRLNRCLLRDENDDVILDSVIGLEILLLENKKKKKNKSQNKISINKMLQEKMAIIATNEDNFFAFPYSKAETIIMMRKIYEKRSDIVHDGIFGKNNAVIKENQYNLIDLSIEFLRYALWYYIYKFA